MEGSVIAFAFFALIIGCAIGLVTTRFIFNDNDSSKAQIIQNEFNDYQREVIEHMDTTLELFKKLNQDYKELDQHLSNGVERLSLDVATKERLLNNFKDTTKSIEHTSANITSQPPKDYAPKTAGEPGDLSRI